MVRSKHSDVAASARPEEPSNLRMLMSKRVIPKNSNKPWTPGNDSRLLELWAAGKPHVLIGPALGRTTGAIEGRLSTLNTRTARLKRERAAEVSGDTPKSGGEQTPATNSDDGR
jgi:hypothetical protein